MRSGRSEPHALAGAYALDALTSIDRRRFERHLTRCKLCARELTRMRESAAGLAAATAAEPPHWLIERVVAAAKHTRQLPPAVRQPATPRPARLAGAARPGPHRTSWRMRLAAALAAGVMIFAGILGLVTHAAQHQVAEDQRASHAVAAILTARDATMISGRVTGGGTATVVMSARARALVFAAAGLRALPRSQCYQLWLMGPGGDTTAGMLPAPRQGMSGPVLAAGLKTGDRLGLTVEPSGGSPRPTSAMILILAL
jgi:anti-sigma-K factor RskA